MQEILYVIGSILLVIFVLYKKGFNFIGPDSKGKLGLFATFVNCFESIKWSQIGSWANRNPFSQYLPFEYYDPDTQIYGNRDKTQGFVFECTPIPGSDNEILSSIVALLESFPNKTILSVSLMSSPHIKPFLDRFRELKVKKDTNPLVDESVRHTYEFLLKGAKGLPQLFDTPIREVKLIIAVKFDSRDVDEINIGELRATTKESLVGMCLSPRNCDPDSLIDLMYQLFNGEHDDNARWDVLNPISQSMIKADTIVEKLTDKLRIGKRYFKCVTPKNINKFVSLDSTSYFLGGNRGVFDDSNQITSHFLATTVIIKDSKIATEIRNKATFFKKQESDRSIIAGTISQYIDEFLRAVNMLETGKSFYYVMPMTWVFHEDERQVTQSSQRAQRLLQTQGHVAQEENDILIPLLISALPFGFYNLKGNLESLNRYFIAPAKDASALLPVVFDSKGGGEPHIPFISRRGQLISFDPFDKNASNRNACVMGASGGGKSFTLNGYVFSCFNSGAIIRIFDLGYSYQKLCGLCGGDYIDIGLENDICLNPFTFVPTGDSVEEKEERMHQLNTIADLLGAMVYSKSGVLPKESEMSLLKFAINFAWQDSGTEGCVDNIYAYLSKFPDLATDEKEHLCQDESTCLADLKSVAQMMAFNLTDWTSHGGEFASWFNGKANINLTDNEFIVLELERIKKIKKLFNVISMAIINASTSTLYSLSRSIRKVMLWEECGVVLQGNRLFQRLVEEAYRRGRKNNVSTITVFQSPLDLQPLGSLGKVILSNSEFHIYFPTTDYKKAIMEGVLPYPKEAIDLLLSIKSARPRYGEVGLKTPYGLTVGRVIVDPFAYWINTSDADDWGKLQARLKDNNGDLVKTLNELAVIRDREIAQYFKPE